MSTTIEVKCATCGFPCDPKCDMYDEDSHEWFHIGNRCGTTPIGLVLSAGDSLADAARPAFEILTALAAAVEWELHPSIVKKMREVAPKLGEQLLAWDAARKR